MNLTHFPDVTMSLMPSDQKFSYKFLKKSLLSDDMWQYNWKINFFLWYYLFQAKCLYFYNLLSKDAFQYSFLCMSNPHVNFCFCWSDVNQNSNSSMLRSIFCTRANFSTWLHFWERPTEETPPFRGGTRAWISHYMVKHERRGRHLISFWFFVVIIFLLFERDNILVFFPICCEHKLKYCSVVD